MGTASPIDLRSDTVTRPDAEMRRAMAAAEVGDDLFGEDPTVRRLEELAAATVGTEAAIFVPSGTMGNEIALYLQAPRGTEVVCEARSHIVDYEMAAMAVLSGLLPRGVAAPDGVLAPEAVEAAIVVPSPVRAGAGLVAVENTHNLAGGTVVPPARSRALVEVARRHSLPVHLDGARLFNAAVALEVPVGELTAGYDSVMVTLSKGLGAPVGSLLCGGRALIEEARRVRRMLGGSMRQAGILAAAGILALEKGPGRLAEDHANARRLAAGLAAIDGLEVGDPEAVQTNIVIATVAERSGSSIGRSQTPAGSFVARLREVGVLAVPLDRHRVRFVTHRDVSTADIDTALDRLRRL